MKRHLFEELLSAYIDDEVTPEERQLVDEELARSPEAARLLDDLRSTVRLVRDLPRHALPEEFAEQVAGQIERDVLLAPRPRPGNRLARWVAWTSAAGGIAAAVLLAVVLWPVSQPMADGERPALEVAEAPQAEPPALKDAETAAPAAAVSTVRPAKAKGGVPADRVAGKAAGGRGGAAFQDGRAGEKAKAGVAKDTPALTKLDRDAKADAAIAMRSEADKEPAKTPADGDAKKAPTAVAVKPAEETLRVTDRMARTKTEALGAVEPGVAQPAKGRLVEGLVEPGDVLRLGEPCVASVVVVDVQEGLHMVNLTLASNRIQRMDTFKLLPRDRDVRKNVERLLGRAYRVPRDEAVLVVANGEPSQIRRALAEIQRSPKVRTVDVHFLASPVRQRNLADLTRQMAFMNRQRGAKVFARRAPSRPGAAKAAKAEREDTDWTTFPAAKAGPGGGLAKPTTAGKAAIGQAPAIQDEAGGQAKQQRRPQPAPTTAPRASQQAGQVAQQVVEEQRQGGRGRRRVRRAGGLRQAQLLLILQTHTAAAVSQPASRPSSAAKTPAAK